MTKPLYLTPRFKTPVYRSAAEAPWDAKRWPNFKPSELICKGDGLIAINEEAFDKLQELRTLIGKAFYVNSAYRSPAYNARIGGAKESYHMEGIAFDISTQNHDRSAFVKAAEKIGFDGIGLYPSFIHIDTRGFRARW